MSDIRTVAKSAAEGVKEFNKRLLKECEEMPVTSFEAVVADGEPVITLISELIQVDDEMIKEDSTLKLGDMVPDTDPIEVQILRIGTADKGAALAEQHTDVLNDRAEGEVEEVRYIQGMMTDWMRDRNDFDANGKETSATPHWVKVDRQAVFCIVAYIMQYEDEKKTAAEPELAGGKKKS